MPLLSRVLKPMTSHAMIASAGFVLAFGVQAANLTLIGHWSEQIGSSDLVGGAGSNLQSSFQSDSAQTTLSVSGTAGQPWMVRLRRDGAEFPSGVALEVQRTNSGNCSNLSGGIDPLVVSSQDQILFSGMGDCNGIALQLRLQGISVQQTPGIYGTSLVYSLQ